MSIAKKIPYIIGFMLICISVTIAYRLHQLDSAPIKSVSANNQPKGITFSIDPSAVESLVNQYRTEHGLSTLSNNPALVTTAQQRCDDMVAKNYFDHVQPDGTQWYVTLRQNVTYYQNANENIAEGYTTSNDVVSGWLNSPDHLKAIVDPSFTEDGVAICHSNNFLYAGEAVVVVQEFLQPAKPQQVAQQAAPSRNPSGKPYNPADTSTWPLCDPLSPVPYSVAYQTSDCLPN